MNCGCRVIELHDEVAARRFPVLVFYPTEAPEAPQPFGPYTISAARDEPVAAGRYPLIVISHGNGGSHLVYRSLAAHLARHGCVVAVPEHPGNNRNNNELAGTAAILADRPRQIRLVIDWALSEAGIGASGPVVVIGHSLGGYTALAVAGGKPTAFPHEAPAWDARQVPVIPDSRVQALILFAPAAAWYMSPGALSDVRIPILMLTPEIDPYTPGFHAAIVKEGVSAAAIVEHREVPNAGHFSFLTPFPPEMRKPGFLPAQDPPGFDRERFHEELNAEVLAFVRRFI